MSDPASLGPAESEHETMDLGGGGDVRLSLVLLDAAPAGRTVALQPHLLIGRAPDCGLCIDRPDVSRHHARIRVGADKQVSIVDLGSSNGTFVNGRRVEESALEVGDHLTVGSAVLLLTHSAHAEELALHHQRMEAMGRLAGGVVHDFNNLIGVFLGNVSVLEHLEPGTPLESGDVREILEDLRLAGRRASEMTEQLLSFSRKKVPEQRTVDVSSLGQEVLRLCRRTFDRRVELEARVVPGLSVVGDQGQLHQVLMNLFINARDAMPSGGRILLEVSAVSDARGSWVKLTVSDTGTGMPPEVVARLFEPFFTTKGPGRGTGLGLSTVQSIVQAHGGNVAVVSELGAGTALEVLLPRVSELRQEVRTPMATLVPREGEARTALVIDDDELHLRASARLLEACGHRVLVAPNGREGLDLFVREQGRVALVLIDVLLPGPSGDELCRVFRELDPEVKVVLMSGKSRLDAGGVKDAGAHAFLDKPFDLGALMRATA